MTDNTSSTKQLQSFKWFLQQMPEEFLSTRLQNNWSASRQVRQKKCTKWQNYSAQWLEKGFEGFAKKSLKLLAQRKAVIQKYSLVVSDTRQVILPAHRTQGALQLALIIPWSARNKTDVHVIVVTFPTYFLSCNKQSFWLPPQISPAHKVFGERVAVNPFSFGQFAVTQVPGLPQNRWLLQGQKKSDQSWGGGLTPLNNFASCCFNADFIFTALLYRGLVLKAVFSII